MSTPVLDTKDTPDWLDAVSDWINTKGLVCAAEGGPPPAPYRARPGCFRRTGHTGRHLGIVTTVGAADKPVTCAWAVWDEEDPKERA